MAATVIIHPPVYTDPEDVQKVLDRVSEIISRSWERLIREGKAKEALDLMNKSRRERGLPDVEVVRYGS